METDNSPRRLDLLLDVPMEITVELGRSRMTIQELLALSPGSVIELDKLAGEPLDVLVNDRLIARGEAVVVNDKFGIRITDIVSRAERIARLR
jgi:flagellar motor switch protein FliN/FliY